MAELNSKKTNQNLLIKGSVEGEGYHHFSYFGTTATFLPKREQAAEQALFIKD